jgi:hypothetical protein
VNGVILDSQLVPVAFSAPPVAALRRTGFTPRFDYQLSTNHTLSALLVQPEIAQNTETGLPQASAFANSATSAFGASLISSPVLAEPGLTYFTALAARRPNCRPALLGSLDDSLPALRA